MKNTKLAASHGECLFFESNIPKNAKQLLVGNDLKIADSETSGNHHLVENAEGCEFYELDGVRYMKNSQPTNVKCVMTERHDTFEIPAGEWEFGYYQEYDHIEQQAMNVRD